MRIGGIAGNAQGIRKFNSFNSGRQLCEKRFAALSSECERGSNALSVCGAFLSGQNANFCRAVPGACSPTTVIYDVVTCTSEHFFREKVSLQGGVLAPGIKSSDVLAVNGANEFTDVGKTVAHVKGRDRVYLL
jgi:hypothetical protein